MPAGRPTKLTPAVIETSKDYLDNYETYGDVIPSMAGLSDAINVAISTVHLWATKEGTEFSELAKQIHNRQGKVLCNGGLKGDYNASIAKLMLTKHGYSDKQELTGNDGEKLIPDGFIINHVSAGS